MEGMARLSTYPPLTSTANDTDLVPLTSGGGTQNIPVINLIRSPFVTVGPAGSFSDYICDGISDQVEIQAAIDAVNAAGGGIVFLRAGTYTLSAEISIKNRSNITIQGQGVGVTKIMQYGIRKNDNTTTSNMVFRDFTIDINGNTAQAMALTNNSYFFHIQRVEFKNAGSNFLLQWGAVDRLIVEDCYFYDGGLVVGKDNAAGGQIVTTNNTTVFRNNWFVKEFSAGGGLITTGQTGNLLIEGNSLIDLSNNCYAAFSAEQQTGSSKCIQVVNNKCYRVGIQLGVSGNVGAGVHIDKGIIAHNIIEGVAGASTASGITTTAVTDLLISTNIINNTSYGIFSSSNGYVKIVNNKIKNTDTASSGFPSDKAGIYSTLHTVLEAEGNTIWDDQGVGTTPYGIRIVGGTNNVYLSHNKCLGPFVTSAFQITSTQSKLVMDNNDFSGGSISLGAITSLYADDNIGINPKILYTQGNITGATTFTRANGNHITATATGNIVTTITNGLVKGDRLVLELSQDSTGGRTMTKPSNAKLVGGAFLPTATANAIDMWELEWDGTSWIEVSRSLNVS